MAISIHAPTRGATITIFANFIFHIISIHAPTRGATIPGHGHLWHTAMISIHAPTRGATVSYIAARKRFGISIHAPTRGATPMGVQYLPVSADFNPRSHKGSDGMYLVTNATDGHFNPRSHKGSDAQSGTLADGIWSFQSTLPQGERPYYAPPFIPLTLFQSTLPQGERQF